MHCPKNLIGTFSASAWAAADGVAAGVLCVPAGGSPLGVGDEVTDGEARGLIVGLAKGEPEGLTLATGTAGVEVVLEESTVWALFVGAALVVVTTGSGLTPGHPDKIASSAAFVAGFFCIFSSDGQGVGGQILKSMKASIAPRTK